MNNRPNSLYAFGINHQRFDKSEGTCSRGVIRYDAEVWRSQPAEHFADRKDTWSVLCFMDGEHIKTITPDRQSYARCVELMLHWTGEKLA